MVHRVNIKLIDGDRDALCIARAPFEYKHKTTLEDMLTFAKAHTGRDCIALQYVHVYHSGTSEPFCLWASYWPDWRKSLILGRPIWDALLGASTVHLHFETNGSSPSPHPSPSPFLATLQC